jgi:hypothetical protein
MPPLTGASTPQIGTALNKQRLVIGCHGCSGRGRRWPAARFAQQQQ